MKYKGGISGRVFVCREFIVWRRLGVNKEGLFVIYIMDNGLGIRINKERINKKDIYSL